MQTVGGGGWGFRLLLGRMRLRVKGLGFTNGIL